MVVFNNQVTLNDGIYISYEEILNDSPKYPNYNLGAQENSFDTIEETLFAYVHNGALYILYKNNFFKIIIRGTISVFYNEMKYSYYPYGFTYSEDKIFFVDFMNGNIKTLNLKNIEGIIMRDKVLYDEFLKLSNSKKRKSLLPYILKYNNRNPVYIELH
jgi:hypothetical protein